MTKHPSFSVGNQTEKRRVFFLAFLNLIGNNNHRFLLYIWGHNKHKKGRHIMRQGKVKWYNGKKCFGFITPDTPNENGNTDDVFVHSSALKAAGIRFLNENDIVEFDEEVRNDKLSVTTLKLVQRDEESARRFQERRAERRRAAEDRKQREEKSERRSGFAFWKK